MGEQEGELKTEPRNNEQLEFTGSVNLQKGKCFTQNKTFYINTVCHKLEQI